MQRGQDSQEVQKLATLPALHNIRSPGEDPSRIPHLMDISLGVRVTKMAMPKEMWLFNLANWPSNMKNSSSNVFFKA